MNLPLIEYPFILLTPAMIGGAQGANGDPEMRIPSIRGQVRHWHRKANLTPSCNDVWGQAEPQVIASKVSLALKQGSNHQIGDSPILPHKNRALRSAICANSHFTLQLRRLVGCGNDHWNAAQKAVKLWLLLGGLGLRVNRAAGSVWPAGDWVPKSEGEFRKTVAELGYNGILHILKRNERNSPIELRRTASDTLNGFPHLFGSIQPRRTPSPLKMKVIRLEASHRLLLTGLPLNLMEEVHRRLANRELWQFDEWSTA